MSFIDTARFRFRASARGMALGNGRFRCPSHKTVAKTEFLVLSERIIAMSRHASRQKLAREFGATDIVTERGDEGIARIKE